jgi:hypothetical protein
MTIEKMKSAVESYNRLETKAIRLGKWKMFLHKTGHGDHDSFDRFDKRHSHHSTESNSKSGFKLWYDDYGYDLLDLVRVSVTFEELASTLEENTNKWEAEYEERMKVEAEKKRLEEELKQQANEKAERKRYESLKKKYEGG